MKHLELVVWSWLFIQAVLGFGLNTKRLNEPQWTENAVAVVMSRNWHNMVGNLLLVNTIVRLPDEKTKDLLLEIAVPLLAAVLELVKSWRLFQMALILISFGQLCWFVYASTAYATALYIVVTVGCASVLMMDLSNDIFSLHTTIADIERVQQYYTIIFQIRSNDVVRLILFAQPVLSVYVLYTGELKSVIALSFTLCMVIYMTIALAWNSRVAKSDKSIQMLIPMQKEPLPKGEKA